MKDKSLKTTKKSKILNLGRKNMFILISFFLSLAIMLLIYICYSIIPFGNNTVLRMDLYHQYGPLFAELYDRITHGSSFLYSWTSGGGSCFLGNFFNYLSSPLSIFVLLFGHKNNPEAIAFLIAIKVALASAFMCYYLKKSDEFSKSNSSTVAFSVLYSFCGYFIAFYWNVMWLDAMVLLPLVVLGIEKIINDRKCMLYTITLAITIISNYYLGYITCLFSVMYAVMYYFGKYSFTSKYAEIDYNKKTTFLNKLRNNRLVVSVSSYIFASLTAVLLCAFCLLPIYFILKNSSATSGEFPNEITSYFKAFDFLVNHFAGLDPTIRSSGDDVLPNIYCGIITILLSLLYLFIKSIPTKEKVSRILMLIALYFSFNLNTLNYIWHGFHFPNDLPYRQSFVYSFILITIAYKALTKINEISNKDIVKIGIGLLTFVIIAEKVGSKNILESTILISSIFVVIYTLILVLFNNYKMQKGIVAVILLCCVVVETTVANTDHYVMDQEKKNYTCDYEGFKKVKEKILSQDKEAFYRMELTELNMRMDPCWFGYNGVSTFSSMAYEKNANLQYNLGMFGNYINSYTYYPQTPIYNSMFSLKYLINNTNKNHMNKQLYTKIDKINNYTIYRNNYNLPIAFCADKKLCKWNSTSSNPFTNQNNFMYYSTGIDNVLKQIYVDSIDYDNITEFTDDLNSGNYTLYRADENSKVASIDMNFVVPERQNVYIYTKSDEIENDTIVVKADGCEIGDQNIDEEYIYDAGVWNAGTVITISMPIKENTNSGYIDCYVYGLNMLKFSKAFNKLNSSAINITEFKENDIKGIINAKDDCVVYTSIPYDTSWKVYIDNVPANEHNIIKIGDALLGVKLSKGEHDIEFKYVPKGLTSGNIITTTMIIAIIGYQIYKKKRYES